MKKRLSNISSEWMLLLLYTGTFILLVLLRNSEFWHQRKTSVTLVQLVSRANCRLSTFANLYTPAVNEEVALLKSLYSVHEEKTGNVLKEIITQTRTNDSLIIDFKKKITDPGELQLFNELKLLNEKKKESLDLFFQLITEAKYDDAVTLYETNLNNLYRQIRDVKEDLLKKIVSDDKVLINASERKLIHINNLNVWISIAILLLLISLGMFLFRLVKMKRKANLELKESEKKYRTFTEQTNEIIEKCDATGRFVFANDFFKRRLEYNDEDLSNLTISDILAEGSMDIDQEISRSEVFANVEKIFKSKSGKRIHIEGTMLLEYKNGKFDGSVGFFNDVTEKKKLEESLVASELKFRNFFDLAPIPMFVIDPQTNKFMLVNKAASGHYGYSENEFYNMTIFDIRYADDIVKESADVERVKEETLNLAQDKMKKYNFYHLKKGSEKIEVESYTSPILINDQKCILSVSIDVTERNQFEKKITKAIIKTQEDERYEIGSELHDNVCQILAAAKMNLGMLKASLPPVGIQPYNQCYEAILLATNEIRNLSHRLAPAFFDNTKLEDAFESLLKTLNIKDNYNISIFFDKASKNISMSGEIKLNLFRILQEQLRNIIQYARCSHIEVKLFVYHDKLYMRIADNGIGFDINLVNEGIGIANMKRRAQLFSGELHLNSSVGKGTELLIVIPTEEMS
jgi:PAS domain S-box-containing protein